MIAFKEPFIDRYLIVLVSKVREELKENLPEKGFFAEMVVQADEIVNRLTKE